MRPTRATLAVVTSAALLASAAGCDSATTEDTAATTILIAADLELTGSAASVGNAYRQALELKRDQLNAAAGPNGLRIELDIKDNRSDSKLSAQNITQFANNSSVAALITGTCAECLTASLETIKQRKLPTISLSPSSDVVTPLDDSRQFVFKIASNPLDNASALVSEMESAAIDRVALVWTEDAYGKNARDAIVGETGAADIRIVANRQITPGDEKVDTAVGQAIASSPKALVVAALPDRAQEVVISARNAGFEGQIFLDAAAAGDLFLSKEGQAATDNATLVFSQTLSINGVIANTPIKALRQAWAAEYTSRYGTYYGPSSFAADAMQIIANSVDRAGGTNGDALRGAIETAQLDGLTGPIRLTPTNHSGLMPQTLVTLVANGGRWQLKA
ncbi:ABC transporter substrate-binding protein [Catenuloplanes japonicus]|uniref:ABC transporter substrate-binding protein n=1 Tax=Catenuloplanes japonicus TaxID=33876 RepID=UPI00052581DC|nr:ABC transporter substrate-binding protein [Catenuloplanes japonicus]